ncbi:hypothetical protein C0J52_18380 [Blattella germanica]|nr:hypothetical protein C0J52_18380 [Blattella germanica]
MSINIYTRTFIFILAAGLFGFTSTKVAVQDGKMEEYTFFFKGVQEKMKLTRRTCSCLGFSCGCCASMNIQTFNFNRYACMNLTYDPYDFAVTSKMIMNDSEIFTTTFSGNIKKINYSGLNKYILKTWIRDAFTFNLPLHL